MDKSSGAQHVEAEAWRSGLATSAVESLDNDRTTPYRIPGPLRAVVKMRDGSDAAQKIADRWNFSCTGNQIIFNDKHNLLKKII